MSKVFFETFEINMGGALGFEELVLFLMFLICLQEGIFQKSNTNHNFDLY